MADDGQSGPRPVAAMRVFIGHSDPGRMGLIEESDKEPWGEDCAAIPLSLTKYVSGKISVAT
jgi:hypothetical protein